MQHLIIKTTETGFQIENLPYSKLVLSHKEDEVTIIPEQQNTFELPKSVLASIRTPGESIIKILVPNSDNVLTELDLETFNLTADSQLFFDYEKSRYFLYVSQQNTLRIITDQNPSVMSYHHSHQIKKVEGSKAGTFELTVNSNFFKLTDLRVILKERYSKQKLVIKPVLQKEEKIENNLFRSTFFFTITGKNAHQLADKSMSITEYNRAIYDLYFNFSIYEHPLTDYPIRIKYFKTHKTQEEILDFNSTYQVLIETYPTNKYNNLSFKASFVPKETLSLYKEITQKDPLPKSHNKKKKMLILEYPHKAQDNGLVFFKYIVDKHLDEFDVFYLITSDSKDLNNLAGYEQYLVEYKSKQHLELFTQLDILVHTHTTSYALPFSSNFFDPYLDGMFKVFLQHGITGVRNVSRLYAKNADRSFTNLFIVSSEREKQLCINEMGYSENEVALTGFSRFDNLLSLKSKFKYLISKKKLLIMPSWRSGNEHLSFNEFMKTDFFKHYNSLIQNKELKSYASRYKIDVNFYLHTNFQKYNELFTSDFVNIIEEGSVTVQELLTMSSILITDYSSVGLDFSILKRPIIYFHFDDLPETANYADFKAFLPGNIVETELELMDQLHAIKPGTKMEDRFVRRLPQIYAFSDRKANKRIYQAILSHINQS